MDNSLQRQILALDREEKRLQMELEDVLSDMETPENSDVEGEDVEEQDLPMVRQTLMDTRSCPVRWTTYLPLYQDQVYREKAEKKVRKLKNMAKKFTISGVILTQQFASSLRRIEALYPDDGGRVGLNSLMACYYLLNPGY